MEINFPKIEEKILKYWEENKIFEKSILQRKNAKDFVFYEGPPTANGKPGIHHVLSRVYKDIICRYKTMRGFRVLRKAGWDTHGLPVELEIEKKLGLKNKKDIEKYGIAEFNKKCRESVWQYKDEWEKLTTRIGFWLDMEHPYITYENDYIESVWRIIKQIYQKGLLYKDYKVVPHCPRCGTSLSSHEVALGYEKVKETSVYIKFKILSAKEKWQNAFILSWTTTPWTLPGNVALAINPEFTYVKAKINNEILVLAKERLSVLGEGYAVIEEFKGVNLLGLSYQPLFNIPPLKTQNAYKIYPADFVTLEEGTGVVHTAVMYGEDDYNLGKKENLPTFHTVTEEGKFVETLGEGLQGLEVKNKETESLIINSLGKKGFLFKEEQYLHDYPFCWRCSSPLLYYAKQGWFINMQQVKEDLIKNNEKINWVPAYLKEGRFGEWLRELKDWAFSRERYWGTPLPVWQCQKCGHQEVIDGKRDLLSQKFTDNKYFFLRHGEAVTNVKKISTCWPERVHSPLTEKGERQIREVAQKLKKEKIDLIFSSELLRARQTAEIVGKKLGIKIEIDNRLREAGVGVFNGKPVEETGEAWNMGEKLSPLEHYSRRFQVALPGGENYAEIEKRIFGFLKEINQKYQGKNILIVVHEAPFTLLEKALSGHNMEEYVKIILEDKQIKNGELRKLEFKNLPYDEKMTLDFHRPYIDEVKFQCPKCDGLITRVPEVIDCWFDSGSMPFASAAKFPADYICEAIDQTRGWFYTLLAIATLLGRGTPYKNVISVGHVLDKKGEKMSKSKGNVIDPWLVVEKYGADATRWYFYTVNQPGDAKLFAEKEVGEDLKKFIMTYWNSFVFFETYKDIKNVKHRVSNNVLDRWVISRLNGLIVEVTKKLDDYDITGAARAIEDFVVNDLSLWYIRRSRKRFQEAQNTLAFALSTLSKLTAPFIPFLSEEIYKCAPSEGAQSVHLADWPKADKKLINKKLDRDMERARMVVNAALAERAKIGIKVRQPLQELQITEKISEELLELIREEINVKKISLGKELKLDTKITPELKEEGTIREVIRQIQEMRKKAGYKPEHEISVQCFGGEQLNEILNKNKPIILKETKAKDFRLGEKLDKTFDVEANVIVDQQNLWLGIKRNSPST